MKKIFKFLSMVLCLLIITILTGCASGSKTSNMAGRGDEELPASAPTGEKAADYGYSGEGAYSSVPSVAGKTAATGSADSSNGGESQIPARQLTSKAIYDIDDYTEWLELFASNQDSSMGTFSYEEQNWLGFSELSTLNRLTVHVENGANRDIKVVAKIDDEQVYVSTTNAFGNAYIYLPKNNEKSVSLKLYNGQEEINSIVLDTMPENNLYTFDYSSSASSNVTVNTIDLCFLVDTTGSMGDELSYLIAELANVIERVSDNLESTIRLGLVFYRDTTDSYTTKKFDFTTDIATQLKNLNQQSANGGGDFEEAVEVGLQKAVSEMSWSSTPSTKLVFHVLDAPPHSNQTNLFNFESEIRLASEKGIRLIPVASSGINKWTEYLLRCEALLTGGVYTCLTNDSGIGNSHIDPSTSKEISVEYLNEMIIRLIKEYHTGTKITPISYRQVSE